MTKEEIIAQAEQLNWFQPIELFPDYITKGVVDHCTEEVANSRYGIPLNLKGKTVLDIGANCGYHSFLAESRGATVTSIDPNQGDGDNHKCFKLAKQALKSSVKFLPMDLREFVEDLKWASEEEPTEWDIVFYFGVLYHVDNPWNELSLLRGLTKGYSLIETAICDPIDPSSAYWECKPGFDGDESNVWYPSLKGLEVSLKQAGFRSMEIIHVMPGRERATVKAIV